MTWLESTIEFFKQHWLTIVLIVSVWVLFLKSFSQYLVDIAKISPEKTDDEKAKKFRSHVLAFIKFIKSLFNIKNK